MQSHAFADAAIRADVSTRPDNRSSRDAGTGCDHGIRPYARRSIYVRRRVDRRARVRAGRSKRLRMQYSRDTCVSRVRVGRHEDSARRLTCVFFSQNDSSRRRRRQLLDICIACWTR